MKMKIALSLLAAAALLPACTTTQTTSRANPRDIDAKGSYANSVLGQEPAPPAEGPAVAEVDIPSAGPQTVDNPAYVPTPLLRGSAASQP